MELRHLRYLLAVVDEGSFRRAAERLHISHPPLTRQIRDLEAEVGAQLLERMARGVRLTSSGAILAREARTIFLRLDEAVEEIRRQGAGRSGLLRVGHTRGYMEPSLAKMLSVMRKRFPAIEVRLTALEVYEQFDAIKAGEIDIGYCGIHPSYLDDALSFTCLRTMEVGLLLAPGHRLAQFPRILRSQLADETMISLPYLAGYNSWLLEQGMLQETALTAETIQAAIVFVASGAGVAIMPAIWEREGAGVVYRPLVPPLEDFKYNIAWRKRDASPLVNTFLSLIDNPTIADEGPQPPMADATNTEPM